MSTENQTHERSTTPAQESVLWEIEASIEGWSEMSLADTFPIINATTAVGNAAITQLREAVPDLTFEQTLQLLETYFRECKKKKITDGKFPTLRTTSTA